eukprot:scaffold125759_cov29-Tisochrysis_lutea.AAC.3
MITARHAESEKSTPSESRPRQTASRIAPPAPVRSEAATCSLKAAIAVATSDAERGSIMTCLCFMSLWRIEGEPSAPDRAQRSYALLSAA